MTATGRDTQVFSRRVLFGKDRKPSNALVQWLKWIKNMWSK